MIVNCKMWYLSTTVIVLFKSKSSPPFDVHLPSATVYELPGHFTIPTVDMANECFTIL